MNLLKGITPTLQGRKVIDSFAGFRTTPTPGNVMVYNQAAKIIGITDGSRVVIEEATDLAEGQIKVQYPFNSAGAKSFAHPGTLMVYKGYVSDADRFADKYAAEHDSTGLKGEARKAYNADQAEYVKAQLAAAKSNDVKSYGNKCRGAGSNLIASNKATWKTMGGNTDTNVRFTMSSAFFGIAVHEDGTAYPVGSEDDIRDIKSPLFAFVYLQGGAGDQYADTQEWDNPTDFDKLEEVAVPFYLLKFESEEDKASSTDDDATAVTADDDDDDDDLDGEQV